ncbi:MAG: hypothetical protein IT431_01555 [Phycisphaerales bacterium]|nr:hypothetical protein [Phycisphaerales bacterium]
MSLVKIGLVAFSLATGSVAGMQPHEKHIVVQVWCDGDPDPVNTYYWENDPIAINVGEWGGCPTHVNIWDHTPANDHSIGPITLYGSRTNEIKVTVSSGAWKGEDLPIAVTGGDWAGLQLSGTGLDGKVWLEGHVGGDLTGLVSVSRVFRFRADGEIGAGVQADTAGPENSFWLYAGSIGPGGNATSTSDNIQRVETLTGDLAGAVSADGDIGSIIVAGDLLAGNNNPDIHSGGHITRIEVGGKIGDPLMDNKPVIVATTGIGAYQGGFEVGITADSIHADITSDDGVSSFNSLWWLETRDGDFTGSLRGRYLERYDDQDPHITMFVDGDIDADITITENTDGRVLATGALAGGRVFTIGRIFNTLSAMTLGDAGLEGRVIIRALNDPNWPVGWRPEAFVKVGSITLAPEPYYDNKSSTLGGGAVGEVPYYLHYADCTPSASKVQENMTTGLDGWADCNGYHIDKVLSPVGSLTEVTLHHYGPVEREGTGMPIAVYTTPMYQLNCVWENVTGSFTVTMHPGGQAREVRVEGSFDPGHLYRIQPKPVTTGGDYLYCAGLDPSIQNDVGVRPYVLVIRVRRIQDITLNGLLQPDDITAWLAEPEDTTLDGITDNADLVDVTEAVAGSEDW